jgi:hypothetical protein
MELTAMRSGRSDGIVTATGAIVGHDADAERTIADLLDQFATPTTIDLSMNVSSASLLAELSRQSGPVTRTYRSRRSGMFKETPIRRLHDLVALWREGSSDGYDRSLEFAPLGGRYGAIEPTKTAMPYRDAAIVIQYAAICSTSAAPPTRKEGAQWSDACADLMLSHSLGVYSNFAEPDLADEPAAYFGVNAGRVRELKQCYDPNEMIEGILTGRVAGP